MMGLQAGGAMTPGQCPEGPNSTLEEDASCVWEGVGSAGLALPRRACYRTCALPRLGLSVFICGMEQAHRPEELLASRPELPRGPPHFPSSWVPANSPEPFNRKLPQAGFP